MGKGASDFEDTFKHCRSYLPASDILNVKTADPLRLLLQSEECVLQDSARLAGVATTGKFAALADVKELVLLASILLSSRFCSISTADELTKTSKNKGICKSSEGMLWSVRAWGVVSAAFVLILLFPSLHSWEPADAIISPGSGKHQTASPNGLANLGHNPAPPMSSHIFPTSPSFREAPSLRNGNKCPSFSASASEDEYVCDPVSVHIAMTLDEAYLRGSMAAVFSILQHATCPENVVFHFLVTDGDSGFHSLIRSTFPFLKFRIYHFHESLVKDRISSSVRQALEQPLNYARNYLADLLEPCVQRVIYLDSDLVVVDDISKLWVTSLGSHTVGAPEYCHANLTKYFSSSFWADRDLSSTFHGRTPCYFNTGVMIIDLVKWRQQNFTKMIEQWMEVQKERRIYELGSLPPFLLVFAGSVEPVEHRWNQHGLGGDNVNGSCRPLHPGPVSLLHWSGKGKPWARLDSRQPCPLDSLWAPYDLYVN